MTYKLNVEVLAHLLLKISAQLFFSSLHNKTATDGWAGPSDGACQMWLQHLGLCSPPLVSFQGPPSWCLAPPSIYFCRLEARGSSFTALRPLHCVHPKYLSDSFTSLISATALLQAIMQLFGGCTELPSPSIHFDPLSLHSLHRSQIRVSELKSIYHPLA